MLLCVEKNGKLFVLCGGIDLEQGKFSINNRGQDEQQDRRNSFGRAQ